MKHVGEAMLSRCWKPTAELWILGPLNLVKFSHGHPVNDEPCDFYCYYYQCKLECSSSGYGSWVYLGKQSYVF